MTSLDRQLLYRLVLHPLSHQTQPDRATTRSPKGGIVANLLLVLVGLGLVGIGASTLLTQTSSCGSKAVNAEAKQYIGTMNRAQQAYYIEKKQFAQSVIALELGMQAETSNYQYRTQASKDAAFTYGIARRAYRPRKNNFGPFEWQENGPPIRSYVGGVFRVPAQAVGLQENVDEPVLVAIVCEVEQIGPGAVSNPTYHKGQLTCGAGSRQIANSLETTQPSR